jgi:hypothetical protein
MTLITLVGVWALAFGHVGLTQAMKLKGREARVFGILLIAVAAFVLPHVHALIDPHTAKFVGDNEAFRSAYDMLIGAFAAYATAWLQTQVLPGLRMPSIRVSVKRARA